MARHDMTTIITVVMAAQIEVSQSQTRSFHAIQGVVDEWSCVELTRLYCLHSSKNVGLENIVRNVSTSSSASSKVLT